MPAHMAVLPAMFQRAQSSSNVTPNGSVAPASGNWHDICAQQRMFAAEAALQRHFGHASLRPFQRDALAAWAAGRDTIVTMATGAGKSLCFQLPALCEPQGRWALIVSPLVALMQDQVHTLRQRQIPAALCGSGAQGAAAATWPSLAAGAFRLVYMCPEFAIAHLAQLTELRAQICLLGIDEAHCVSSWGHDFRPSYRELGKLRAVLSNVPVMCVTATCPPKVRQDIEMSLGLGRGCTGNIAHIAGPVNRPNLKYTVKPRTTFQADLGELFGIRPGATPDSIKARRAAPVDSSEVGPTASTIIYAGTKARCEEVANWLSARGVAASAYHAGMSMAARRAVHTGFVMDEIQIVVATVAFGMGIDKPSIRRVIHYGFVHTLEHYVQQCGRAGRDGEEAECIAFTRPDQDINESRQLLLQDFARRSGGEAHCENMLALNAECMAYMTDCRQCRRVRLLKHFGEKPIRWKAADASSSPPRGECVVTGDSASDSCARCNFCDVCLSGSIPADAQDGSPNEEDFTEECVKLLRCVGACGGLTGEKIVVSMVAGHATQQVKAKRLERHPSFGTGAGKSLEWWRVFMKHVHLTGFVQHKASQLANGMAYAAVSVSQKGQALLTEYNRGSTPTNRCVLSPVPRELASKVEPAPLLQAASAEVKTIRSCATAPATDDLVRRLMHARLRWMRQHGVFGEAILPNPVLRRFAELRPTSNAAARQNVQGLPGALADDLLSSLVEEVKTFCGQIGLSTDIGVTSITPEGKRPLAESNQTAQNVTPPGKIARRSVSSMSFLRARSKVGDLGSDEPPVATGWLGKPHQASTPQPTNLPQAPAPKPLSALDAFCFHGPATASNATGVGMTATPEVVTALSAEAHKQPDEPDTVRHGSKGDVVQGVDCGIGEPLDDHICNISAQRAAECSMSSAVACGGLLQEQTKLPAHVAREDCRTHTNVGVLSRPPSMKVENGETAAGADSHLQHVAALTPGRRMPWRPGTVEAVSVGLPRSSSTDALHGGQHEATGKLLNSAPGLHRKEVSATMELQAMEESVLSTLDVAQEAVGAEPTPPASEEVSIEPPAVAARREAMTAVTSNEPTTLAEALTELRAARRRVWELETILYGPQQASATAASAPRPTSAVSPPSASASDPSTAVRMAYVPHLNIAPQEFPGRGVQGAPETCARSIAPQPEPIASRDDIPVAASIPRCALGSGPDGHAQQVDGLKETADAELEQAGQEPDALLSVLDL